jgi:hypothetical protein
MVYKFLALGALSFVSKTGENPLKPTGFPTVFDINAVQSDDVFLGFFRM